MLQFRMNAAQIIDIFHVKICYVSKTLLFFKNNVENWYENEDDRDDLPDNQTLDVWAARAKWAWVMKNRAHE